MAEEESLVLRRPKRSTAGNRMELALAELAIEEPQEPEEDNDFVVDKDEEDVFESDFASTDEEAAQEDIDHGDQAMREEDRRERKTARTRVEKATAAAHARQRVTFNPEAALLQPASKSSKPKRRVSLGVVVNAETGEVIEGSTRTVGVKRQSQRRHTVMNTSATVNRIKDAEEKRAAIPKKAKTVSRLPTQDELIARALDTEEGNITEHRDYLRIEEEKRAKARVIKKSVEGPVLRWISKKETVQVEIQLPPPPPPPPTAMTSANMYAANFSFVYTPSVSPLTAGSQVYSTPFYAYRPPSAQSSESKPQETSRPDTASPYTNDNAEVSADPSASTPSSVSAGPSWQQQQPPTQVQSSSQSQAQVPASLPPNFSSTFFTHRPVPTAPLIAHRNEDVCKNYIIHEVSQIVPSNPSWKDTMTALFGNHARWDEVKVFTSKGRPLARPVRTCPVTGQPARYRDPRTNVPFANVGAYGVLSKVLGREYAWCDALGCYMGASGSNRRNIRQADQSKRTSADGDGDDAGELEERRMKRSKTEMRAGA